MTHNIKHISPLRQRMIEDMTMRKLSPKTQTAYIRAVKNFTRFIKRSPDTACAEDPPEAVSAVPGRTGDRER